MDRALSKGVTTDKLKQASKVNIPDGVKCHMIQEVVSDLQKNQKNHWRSIFGLMGVQVGQNQNIVGEILSSYHAQNDALARV